MHQKASAKNSSKLNKFLHSEVNLLIQHINIYNKALKIYKPQIKFFLQSLNYQF